jgi:hypothetical protein
MQNFMEILNILDMSKDFAHLLLFIIMWFIAQNFLEWFPSMQKKISNNCCQYIK